MKFAVVAISCFVGGGVFLERWYAEVPHRAQLVRQDGVVDSVEKGPTARPTERSIILTLRNQPAPFRYGNWLPRFDDVVDTARPGEPVTLWRLDGDDGQIWQIDVRQQRIVSFEEIIDAVRSGRRRDGFFGVALIGAPFLLLAVMISRRQREESTA